MMERNKLFKLMEENPDLPIVFCCSSDEIDNGYSWMFYESFSADICDIYKTDDRIFDCNVDITEYYEDLYENEFENLSKEEFNKRIKELVDNTPHYTAIRVFCS